MPRLSILAVVTQFFLAAAMPLAAQQRSGEEFFGRVVSGIDYVADRPLVRAHFDPMLGCGPGEVLTRTGLKAAIQALYDTGQFSSISAFGEPDGDKVRLTFHLLLNYYFNRFLIEGEVDLGGRLPAEVMDLPVGARFTPERLEESRQIMGRYMRDRGYFQARVETSVVRDAENRQANVTFVIEQGELPTIRSVILTGVAPEQEPAILDKFGFLQGKKYERFRLRQRVENLDQYLLRRGWLAAETQLSEIFDPDDNTIALELRVLNVGEVRVMVEGFGIPRDRLSRLLPVLSGEGLQPWLLEEGAQNLREYLEEQGYPEADVRAEQEVDRTGARTLKYVVEAGRKVTVGDVEFAGNRAFSDDELLASVQVQPARFLQKSVYSISKLDSDVENLRLLYHSSGYLEAQVIPLVQAMGDSSSLKITFEVDEGDLSRVAAVELRGCAQVSEDRLRSRLAMRPGSAYSPQIAERDRQALLAAYNDAGFLQPQVVYSATETGGGRYVLLFDIEEGPRSYVDRVLILGNDRTRRSFIEKRISLGEGEPLSLGGMLETQRALYATGVFDLVRVSPQTPESLARHQSVVVRLTESKRYTIRYGLGYQERERVRGILELSDGNILGTGRRADLRLRGSTIEQGAILSFEQPRIRFLPVNSYLTLSGRRKREVSFDVRRLNFTYQFSRPVGTHAWALLRYSFRNVRVSDLRVSPGELGREDIPRNLSTFSAIFINDTRDNYLDPDRGFFTSADLSLTTKLIGSNNYVSLFTQNSYHWNWTRSLLMAAGLRFGVAQPFGGDRDLPISERFFGGGASSLRGFDTDRAGPLDSKTNQPVGGNAILVGNLEARIPLLSSLRLAMFYDAGNVFRSLGAIRLPDVSHTVGLGLRVKTPLGPLRIDYAINLNLSERLRTLGYDRRQFFITIGPPF